MTEDIGQHNLTTQEGALAHLSGAATKDEWNKRVDELKATHGGDFPSFWSAIMGEAYTSSSARWPTSQLPGPDAKTEAELLDTFRNTLGSEQPPHAPSTSSTPVKSE